MIHDFSPFLFEYQGFGLRYYALAYLLGVLFTYLWLTKAARYDRKLVEDFCLNGFFVIIIGGRLGEFLFYQPQWIWDPIQILKIWQGGMSFHGGFIAVALWTWYFLRKHKWDFWKFADALVVPAAFGIAMAKFGNFMNGELWGRPTDVPWCFVFPNADELCRQPSVLYQVIGNILVGLVLLWGFFKKLPKGANTALFLIGYGIARVIVEIFWREPDWIYLGISSGTWLSVPMIIGGVVILIQSLKRSRLV